jgi:hypothetical protein
MPNFRAYPTVATTPSRKQRKSLRKRIFAENSAAFAEQRRARRDARKKAGL